MTIESPVLCSVCNEPVRFSDLRGLCHCNVCEYRCEQGVFFRELEQSQRSEESIIRDTQAQGYLEHSKFPTQIANFKAWLEHLPKPTGTSIALDLGCGPGPYTRVRFITLSGGRLGSLA